MEMGSTQIGTQFWRSANEDLGAFTGNETIFYTGLGSEVDMFNAVFRELCHM